jgi:hypothetical protein
MSPQRSRSARVNDRTSIPLDQMIFFEREFDDADGTRTRSRVVLSVAEGGKESLLERETVESVDGKGVIRTEQLHDTRREEVEVV